MDRDRFDALARLLGASGSRRATVGALVGAALPSDGQTFEQCHLAGVWAEDCNGCDFRGADLGNAAFSEVSMQGASFRDACLVGADFFAANLDGASLRGAILCNTIFPGGQIRNGSCGKVDSAVRRAWGSARHADRAVSAAGRFNASAVSAWSA